MRALRVICPFAAVLLAGFALVTSQWQTIRIKGSSEGHVLGTANAGLLSQRACKGDDKEQCRTARYSVAIAESEKQLRTLEKRLGRGGGHRSWSSRGSSTKLDRMMSRYRSARQSARRMNLSHLRKALDQQKRIRSVGQITLVCGVLVILLGLALGLTRVLSRPTAPASQGGPHKVLSIAMIVGASALLLSANVFLYSWQMDLDPALKARMSFTPGYSFFVGLLAAVSGLVAGILGLVKPDSAPPPPPGVGAMRPPEASWTESADADLDALVEALEVTDPAAAKRLAQAVVNTVNGLVSRLPPPNAPPPPDLPVALVVPGTDVTVHYRVRDATVEVLRVERTPPAAPNGPGAPPTH